MRCSGETPACAACLRKARWDGRNLDSDHCCVYPPNSTNAAKQSHHAAKRKLILCCGVLRLQVELTYAAAAVPSSEPFATRRSLARHRLHHSLIRRLLLIPFIFRLKNQRSASKR